MAEASTAAQGQSAAPAGEQPSKTFVKSTGTAPRFKEVARVSFQEHAKNLHQAILKDKGMVAEGEGNAASEGSSDPAPEIKNTPETKKNVQNPFLDPSSVLADAPAAPEAPVPADDGLEAFKGPAEGSKSKPEWDKLKTLAQGYKKQLEEQRAALEELKKSTAPSKELEALRATLQEAEKEKSALSDKLKVFDLQSHPEFVNKYTTPMTQMRDTLQTLFTEAGIEDVSADTFLRTPQKEAKDMIKKVMETLDPISQNIVTQMYTEYKQLSINSAKDLASAKTTLESLKASSTQQQQRVFAEVAKSVPLGLKPIEIVEGMTAEQVADAKVFNEELGKIMTNAEHIALRTTSMQEAALASVQAAQFQFLTKQLLPRMTKAFGSEIAALKEKLAKYEKAAGAKARTVPASVSTPPVGNPPSGEQQGDEAPVPALIAAARHSQRKSYYRSVASKMASGVQE